MPAKGHRPHHDERALMFVGTRKGVFVYESDFDRAKWKRTGPYLVDHQISCIAYDYRDQRSVYVATAGGGLHRTRDFGKTWEKVGRGLPSERVSSVTIGHLSEPGAIWVGLEPAALAKSMDGGESFDEIAGFKAIPSAGEWWGREGDPVVTAIVAHSDSPKSLHVGVSVGGVFLTEDGGLTWKGCNEGITPSYPKSHNHGDAHRDVHNLVSNPARPDRLYAVAERGVYRTDDNGDTWKDVSAGLSSPLTRSLVVSPSKPGTVFVVPLKAGTGEPPKVDGALAIYRSREGGDEWDRLSEGLPENVNATVYREALRIDTLDEEGIYVATSNGQILVSLDEGETWTQIVTGLTPILALEIVTEQE